MPDSEIGELQRAMQVGFAQLQGHVDRKFAEVHGRLDVQDERMKGVQETQKRHGKEIDRTVQRRWPLPVLAAVGSLGGLASVVAWATPHK